MMGFEYGPCRANVIKHYKTTKRTVKNLAGRHINEEVKAAMHNKKVMSIEIIKR